MDLKLENISTNGMLKLRATYMYVFLGILLATIGAGIGIEFYKQLTGILFWVIVGLEFVVLFWFLFSKNVISYNIFTFLTGLTLAPVLGTLIDGGLSYIIFQAFLGTAIIVGGLTLYTFTTKHNFMRFSTIAFWILIALVIVSLVNIFLGSPILSLIVSGAAMILFSFFIIMDTQEVLYTDITPLEAAMNLYLDILNLFVNLLQILASLEKD